MLKLKCWKRDTSANNVWYKKDHSKFVIVTDYNLVLVYNWKRKTNNLEKSSGPWIEQKQAKADAQKYMKDHDTC